MIGRENTMFIAFGIEGVGICGAVRATVMIPILFVSCRAWCILPVGEIYSPVSLDLQATRSA